MCMQCMTTAAVAVGSASGIRAWLAARSPSWLTPGRMKALTAGLIGVALVASSISLS
jgi:hypothetical protein